MRRLQLARERGSASLELAIIAPAILVVLGLMIMAGRVAMANGTVNQIAYDAARAATLSRTAAEASAAIDAVVTSNLAGNGITCAGGPGVVADLSPFSLPVGEGGVVTVTVTCSVPLGDLVVFGMPGSAALNGEGSSMLDPWRERG